VVAAIKNPMSNLLSSYSRGVLQNNNAGAALKSGSHPNAGFPLQLMKVLGVPEIGL